MEIDTIWHSKADNNIRICDDIYIYSNVLTLRLYTSCWY